MSCEICGKTNNLKSCGRCLKANYCGREHQLAHWKDHKRWCFKNCFNNNNFYNEIITDNNRQQLLSTDHPIEDLFSTKSANQIGQQSTNKMISLLNQPLNTNDLQNSSINQIIDDNNTAINNYSQMSQDNDCNYDSSACQSINMEITNYPNSINNSNSQNSNINPNSQTFCSPINNFTNLYSQNRDFVLNNLNKYCQIILKDMNKYGFCVIDDFLQNGDLILNEVSLLYERGLFQAGQVVNIKANSNSKLIRGDRIIWVEGNEQICCNIGFLVRILDSIITRCNSMALGEFFKYKINRRTKAMIACYPGNYSKYVRHVDNPNNDGRCITSIYYLNKDYNRERDGGVLRLFPQMNDGIVADVEPKFNRVIFFWSDRRNPHEVMPSTRMRFAITVWYFDANERAKAIQKYKENSIHCPNDKDLVPF